MGAVSQSRPERPDIFTYHDYRTFLADFTTYLKQHNSLSMRELSKICGLSHGYLSLVIKNQRNLSAKALIKLLPHLQLTKSEVIYLKRLITLADARTDFERKKALRDLRGHRKYRVFHAKEFETYKYLEKWYYVVIRELSLTNQFQSDPKWIQQQLPFKLSIKEIEESLSFLIQYGFLVEDQQSRQLKPSKRQVQCLGGIFQLSLRSFHSAMLELAQQALSKFSRNQRKQVGYTIAISANDLDKVKKVIEEAKEKLRAIEQKSQNVDTVYHANFSVFPVAGKGAAK